MQQLIENNIGLPDFITMTNYCESLGYDIEMIRSKKGVTCDVYFNGKLEKIGKIVYPTCIDAQEKTYTKLYKVLTN